MRNLERACWFGNSQHLKTVSSHFDDHQDGLDLDLGSCRGIGDEEIQTHGVGEAGLDGHLVHGVGIVVGLVDTLGFVAASGCCSCIETVLDVLARVGNDDDAGNGGIALDRSDRSVGLAAVDTKTCVRAGEIPRHVPPNAAGLVPWHDVVVLDRDSFWEVGWFGGVHKTPTTPWARPLEIWPENLPQ